MREKRKLIHKEVIINNIIRAEALDISREGMYIYTQANFIPGAIFEISFKIDDSPVRAMVRVQHVQPNVGIGVEFTEISRIDVLKIEQFINSQ